MKINSIAIIILSFFLSLSLAGCSQHYTASDQNVIVDLNLIKSEEDLISMLKTRPEYYNDWLEVEKRINSINERKDFEKQETFLLKMADKYEFNEREEKSLEIFLSMKEYKDNSESMENTLTNFKPKILDNFRDYIYSKIFTSLFEYDFPLQADKNELDSAIKRAGYEVINYSDATNWEMEETRYFLTEKDKNENEYTKMFSVYSDKKNNIIGVNFPYGYINYDILQLFMSSEKAKKVSELYYGLQGNEYSYLWKKLGNNESGQNYLANAAVRVDDIEINFLKSWEGITFTIASYHKQPSLYSEIYDTYIEKIGKETEIQTRELLDLEEIIKKDGNITTESSPIETAKGEIIPTTYEDEMSGKISITKQVFDEYISTKKHSDGYSFIVAGKYVYKSTVYYVIQAGTPSSMNEYYLVDNFTKKENGYWYPKIYEAGWGDVDINTMKLAYETKIFIP